MTVMYDCHVLTAPSAHCARPPSLSLPLLQWMPNNIMYENYTAQAVPLVNDPALIEYLKAKVCGVCACAGAGGPACLPACMRVQLRPSCVSSPLTPYPCTGTGPRHSGEVQARSNAACLHRSCMYASWTLPESATICTLEHRFCH